MYFIVERIAGDSFLAKYLLAVSLLTLRYFAVAGGVFLVFYIWKRRHWFYRKIQQKYPERRRIVYEMRYSISSFFIIGLIATTFSLAVKGGHTQLYYDVAERGWAYLIGSFLLGLFIHDTYFYWVHRAMHHKRVFKYVHKVHHMSHNPTPFAAFSFHPIEAVLEFGFVPIMVLTLPLHPLALAGVSLYMIIMNVMGHVGFEIYPKGFTKHWFGRWFNTSTHHNMHHKHVNCNYGLYFNIWDRLMKTNHAKYHETFEEVKSRPKPIEATTEEELEMALK